MHAVTSYPQFKTCGNSYFVYILTHRTMSICIQNKIPHVLN